jgi:two-component system KDP operon response regulator KdpE
MRVTGGVDVDKTVLLIDKDVGWLTILKRALEREGFSVITATGSKEGIRKAYRNRPQIIVLDVIVEKVDGWATCQRLRQICDTPILILSATAREEDIVRGLSLGADDCRTKTCSPGELSARIHALLRRRGQDRRNTENVYDDGTLYVDLWSRKVASRGKAVDLTPTELRLLMYLVSQRGRIVPHRELLVHVWGHKYAREKRYLAVYIRYLRQKLEEDPARPRYICTRWHVGYYFAGERYPRQTRPIQQVAHAAP